MILIKMKKNSQTDEQSRAWAKAHNHSKKKAYCKARMTLMTSMTFRRLGVREERCPSGNTSCPRVLIRVPPIVELVQ